MHFPLISKHSLNLVITSSIDIIILMIIPTCCTPARMPALCLALVLMVEARELGLETRAFPPFIRSSRRHSWLSQKCFLKIEESPACRVVISQLTALWMEPNVSLKFRAKGVCFASCSNFALLMEFVVGRVDWALLCEVLAQGTRLSLCCCLMSCVSVCVCVSVFYSNSVFFKNLRL